MKVLKYKKSRNGKYIVYFDDGRSTILYEDVILKYNLLLKKEISDDLFKEINDINFEYDVYYVGLKSITSRFKSVYELRKFLSNKEYPEDLIDKAIDKLISQGYLNDRMFARSYINNQISITSNGPIRIKNDLENKKIDSDIIDSEIIAFSDDIQIEKIDKIINKMIKSNHSRGGIVLRQKIINDLKSKGYCYDLICSVIDNYNFNSDSSIAKKEYDRLYKKYSRKYEGVELEKKIKEKMFMKGLIYEGE